VKESKSTLHQLFEPRSVAIIGASRNPSKPGTIILQNLLNANFAGGLFPVNPGAPTILERAAYPSVEAIPEPVDLAIIALPVESVVDEIEKCGRKKVPFAVVLSSGFSEEGRPDLQTKLASAAKKAGVRVIGPNTTGILNAHNGLIATFEKMTTVRPGNVSFVSQTGMFGGFLLAQNLSSEAFGINKVAGVGNKIDLTEADMLEFLEDDKSTDLTVMYLEAVNIRPLRKLAKRVSSKKPILVLRADKTRLGREAMKIHTGSNFGDRQEFDSLCKSSGIIRASSFGELLDFVRAFALLPLPKSNKTAIISNTGGGLVSAADNCQDNGLVLAQLSEATISKIKSISPAWHMVTNPVDVAAAGIQGGNDGAFDTAIQAVLEDDNVDLMMVVIGAAYQEEVPMRIRLLNEQTPHRKPLAIVTMGNQNYLSKLKEAALSRQIPLYDDVVRCVKALGSLYRYKQWQQDNSRVKPHR